MSAQASYSSPWAAEAKAFWGNVCGPLPDDTPLSYTTTDDTRAAPTSSVAASALALSHRPHDTTPIYIHRTPAVNAAPPAEPPLAPIQWTNRNMKPHVLTHYRGGPRQGQPILQRHILLFASLVARMDHPIYGTPIHKRFDMLFEPYDPDDPYEDALHQDNFSLEDIADPNLTMVAGMPHGPYSLEYHRLTWGMPISNLGADPLAQWVASHIWPAGTPDDFVERIIPLLDIEVNRQLA